MHHLKNGSMHDRDEIKRVKLSLIETRLSITYFCYANEFWWCWGIQ
jgi:hypothetical protein